MKTVYCMVALLTALPQLVPAIAINPCIDSCVGVANGNYQSCKGCNVYVSCSNEILYDMPCPATLVWDDGLKRCEYQSKTCRNVVPMDFCDSNPCKNGGRCSNGINTFVCSCPSGYTGVDCSVLTDFCDSNPCKNGGRCSNGINTFVCSCPSGYTGVDCSVPMDFCDSNPCKNGGRCSNGINTFVCSCPSGYTGVDCSVPMDFCDSNPCKNGGKCSNGSNTFVCFCPSGYTGVDCSALDYCQRCGTNPCIDGGNCSNGPNSYSCSYPPGHTGNGCTPDITYSSCVDVYKQNQRAKNSTYTLQNTEGQSYTVYCEFYPTHIYTFIAPDKYTSINLNDLYNNKKEVIIRHRLYDGTQREITYGQIQRYRARDISVQYDSHTGYKGFLNTKMGPYVYMGLLPDTGIQHLRDTQGYSVNARDYTFVNCDGNPNNYFVLLFNKDNAKFNGYKVDTAFMKKWMDDSIQVPSDRELPVEFFSLFEMHMGGCGGYLTTDQIPGLTGATFGLRYDFPLSSCKDVYDKAGSSGAVSGQYYLTNGQNQQYKVYCEFHTDHFYTFVAPTSLRSLPISTLYNNQKEVLVRYRLNNGNQRQSTIGQITKYSSRSISIQYNDHEGYNPIRNRQMDPYMYVGLLPKLGINHRSDLQGYSVNGKDKTFTNCDGNPNAYFALLYNAANVQSSSYNVVNNFMKQWIFDSQQVSTNRYLPDNYFSFFEMHMGGCGGYMTLGHLSDMAGVVFGLKYDMP